MSILVPIYNSEFSNREMEVGHNFSPCEIIRGFKHRTAIINDVTGNYLKKIIKKIRTLLI